VRRRSLVVVAAVCAVAAGAVVVTLVVQSPGHPGRTGTQSSGSSVTTGTPPRQTATGADASEGDASTLVATLSATVPKYASPGGAPTGTVPGSWFGAPSALPVLAQDNGYLQVRLAQRPNGSTAWIAASAATLSTTSYRIVVDLSTEHLMLYKLGHLVLSAPAGIGTVQDPTPTGNFFVALYAAPPTSAWGPFIMVTSGHSNAISDWEKSGDAIVAIHGPLGADAAIGTSGARVSHGCVRLHDADLTQLREVPVGSPVVIED
jgi:lipoprotein-anchoring transpeptidase ErfK/SrfK